MRGERSIISHMGEVVLRYKIIISPQQDAETLVVGLNCLFSSTSRSQTFALAREMTRREITSDELMREMLEAIDLLEKHFVPKQ
jgi:hypothetical protein